MEFCFGSGYCFKILKGKVECPKGKGVLLFGGGTEDTLAHSCVVSRCIKRGRVFLLPGEKGGRMLFKTLVFG